MINQLVNLLHFFIKWRAFKVLSTHSGLDWESKGKKVCFHYPCIAAGQYYLTLHFCKAALSHPNLSFLYSSVSAVTLFQQWKTIHKQPPG